MRLLDRHLLVSFLLPFIYCLLGFLSIWLVFDLASNLTDFIENGVSIPQIAYFYLTQLPAISVLTLPVGLLLALLYSLGRLSQANEIISMLSAGVSLERILVPFFLTGLAVTGLSTFLNYQLAPQADGRRDQMLAEMETGSNKLEKRSATLGHLFRNRADNRLWYVEKMPTDLKKPFQGVQVLQQDAQGDIISKYYAHTAVYAAAEKTWHFLGAKLVKYTTEGDVVPGTERFPKDEAISGWSETPWRVSSSTLEADKLSIPALREYLTLNSDFTRNQLAPFRTYLDYRWALPWSCLVVVCIAAPLGIVYSRRSVVAGVASSIFIFALILFTGNLFLALGRGDRVGSLYAAWTPNVIFTVIGLILLRMRALNQDRFPRTPKELWHFLTVW